MSKLNTANRAKADLTENQVVSLWQDLLASGVELTAENGEPLQIIYPGRLNGERGADFRDVVINSRRGTDRGQIEFHVRSSDWRAHRHHLDQAYRNVVLHVVFWDDTAPIQNPDRYIPTLSLRRYLDISLLRSLRLGEITDSIAVSCRLNSNYTPEQILSFVEAAGEARFQEKAARFSQELRREDPGQVLYRGIMGALGYTKNKQPCMMVADRVPLAELEAIAHNGGYGADSINEILALLLGTAGLLPSQRGGKRDEFSDFLENIWSGYSHEHGVSAGDWSMYKVRPVNSLVRRLAAAGYLIINSGKTGIFQSLLREVEETQVENGRSLSESLQVASDGYWLSHLDFGLVSPKPMPSLVGPDRAAEITVNVILPFAYSLGRRDSNGRLAAKAAEIFLHIPGSPANALEQHMARQFGLSGKIINSALRQQGLLHIYRTFCIQGKCGECGGVVLSL